jgi:hypothetical protein
MLITNNYIDSLLDFRILHCLFAGKSMTKSPIGKYDRTQKTNEL